MDVKKKKKKSLNVFLQSQDFQNPLVCWASTAEYLFCWDARGPKSEVRQAHLPPSEWPLLMSPSGGVSVGISGRRWLVVTHEGRAFVYGLGGDSGVEYDVVIPLLENDSPWRVVHGVLGAISPSSEAIWTILTRDGSIFELSFQSDEARVRPLCGPIMTQVKKGGPWGSWISSFFSGASTENSVHYSACCSIPGSLWLVADEEHVLNAFSMRKDGEVVWKSNVLQRLKRDGSVVDMVFHFKTNLLYVLFEGSSDIFVFHFNDALEERFTLNQQHIPAGVVAQVSSRLVMTDAGTVGVSSLTKASDVSSLPVTPEKSLDVSNISFSRGAADVAETSSATLAAVQHLTPEKAQAMSNELAGAFANDQWLMWAEKLNEVALEKIGQVLRSRVTQHRALLLANPDNKVVQENNVLLLAMHGFFLAYIDLARADEDVEALNTLKNDLVVVIGSCMGPNNSRRLVARSINLMTLMWSCAPVVTHALALLKRFASNQYPHRTRYWAFRLLASATLPLLNTAPPTSVIHPDVILAFLSLEQLNSYGLPKDTFWQLALACVQSATATKEDKVKALGVLEVYGPADVYRRVCLEQKLCLVSISVSDFKKSQRTNREVFYEFLQLSPSFEQELWNELLFDAPALDLAISIANDDNGILSQSLFSYLEKREHLRVLALHSLQCKRYDTSATAFAALSQAEVVDLSKKKNDASLGFLASKCAHLEQHAVDQEMRLCRSIVAVRMSEPLTKKALIQQCLKGIAADTPDIPAHLHVAAGLEVCQPGSDEYNQLIHAAYSRDDWASHVRNLGEGGFDEELGWISQTVLGKLFSLALPLEEVFSEALKDQPPDLVKSVFLGLKALGQARAV